MHTKKFAIALVFAHMLEADSMLKVSEPSLVQVFGGTLNVLPALTAKQQSFLETVLLYFGKHRHYPTQRELAGLIGVKSSNVEAYLKSLEEKGYIEREPRRRRNIRLTSNALEKLLFVESNRRQVAAE
jgi:DNA-binding MarR family transcriptional regulator